VAYANVLELNEELQFSCHLLFGRPTKHTWPQNKTSASTLWARKGVCGV
jgi:hypothetical protein